MSEELEADKLSAKTARNAEGTNKLNRLLDKATKLLAAPSVAHLRHRLQLNVF